MLKASTSGPSNPPIGSLPSPISKRTSSAGDRARAEIARSKFHGKRKTKRTIASDELTKQIRTHTDKMLQRLSPAGTKKRLQEFARKANTMHELEVSLNDKIRYSHNPLQVALTVSMVLSSEALLHYAAGEVSYSTVLYTL